MNTNPEESQPYADLRSSDPDPTLRRLVDDLDALYSVPVPPTHLTVPPVMAGTRAVSAPVPAAPWAILPGGRAADPPRTPTTPPRLAWQPLLRVAALTVLLLGGLLTVVLGLGGPPPSSGLSATTRTPVVDRFSQWALQSVRPLNWPGDAPPVVVLNRRLRVADLPCLGLGSVPGLPADEPVRLVIVRGNMMRPGLSGLESSGYPIVHYVGFVFVERQGEVTMEMDSRNGGIFRMALNDPTLLDDDILPLDTFVGQAQADPVAGRVVAGELGQALHETQTQGAWTVALERVYADTNRVVLLYTVRGPPVRAIFAPLIVTLPTGQQVRSLRWGLSIPTTDGQERTWRVLAILDPHDLSPAAQWTLQVTVLVGQAILATPTPPVPACGPALPADPGTPLPTWTPGPPAPPAATATGAAVAPLGLPMTPVLPDIAEPGNVMAGSFTFDLTVPVVPSTPLPTPVPTAPVGLPQAIPSTGPPTPLPSPR